MSYTSEKQTLLYCKSADTHHLWICTATVLIMYQYIHVFFYIIVESFVPSVPPRDRPTVERPLACLCLRTTTSDKRPDHETNDRGMGRMLTSGCSFMKSPMSFRHWASASTTTWTPLLRRRSSSPTNVSFSPITMRGMP